VVGAPHPDLDAEGVQGQPSLVVGQAAHVGSHGSTPRLQLAEPLARRQPRLALGQHPRALGLERLESATGLGQLSSNVLGRVGIEESEVAQEVLSQMLDLGDLTVHGREVAVRGIVAV